MGTDLAILLATAASIGFVHTLIGPDHYIPFIAMARAGRWSLGRTMGVTFVCGVGHVVGSVALGALGIALGWAVGGLEWFEGVRGNLAGWLLLGFGLAYTCGGLSGIAPIRMFTLTRTGRCTTTGMATSGAMCTYTPGVRLPLAAMFGS
jgi:hypothetical protein